MSKARQYGRARHSQRFGHPYDAGAEGALARCGQLVLPIRGAIVADVASIDRGQKIRMREQRFA